MLDYERLTVRDLKRIVNREEATPAAIGLFVAQAAWEHTRAASIVTNELLRWIEAKWRFKAFANELDYWISLGKLLRQMQIQILITSMEAHIANLATYLELFNFEGTLYKEAFRATHEQADRAGLKLKLPGLSAQKAAMLAALAAGDSHLRATSKYFTKEVAKQARVSHASLLALCNVLQDAAALLDMPALHEEVHEATEHHITALREHREYLDILAPFDSRRANQVSETINLDDLEPDKTIENGLEASFALYLTGQWRVWARAGVNLRELADSSSGIVDLIRQAGIAAGELQHE